MSTSNQEQIFHKAKAIKLLLTDVDGILNDGQVYYGENGEMLKAFHTRDGLAIRHLLPQHGITIGIITGRNSPILTKRMQELNVKYVYQGVQDKLSVYQNIIQNLSLQHCEVAYLGDDLPDLPVMQAVGLSITVPGAPQYIREHADWCTTTLGGHGAFREAADMILHAQGKSMTTLL